MRGNKQADGLGLESLGLHLGNLDVHDDEPRRLGNRELHLDCDDDESRQRESYTDDAGGGHALADVHERYREAGPWGNAGLDDMMWRWVEDDKDAQRTAAFTSFGLLGGRFARRVMFVMAILGLLAPINAAIAEGGTDLYMLQTAWLAGVTLVILALMWAKKPRQASNLFLYGYYPAMASMLWAASCSCSCTPEARCWAHSAEEDKWNLPHRYPQCVTEADWNITDIDVSDSLPRHCITKWVQALAGTATVAALAKWPRHQAFLGAGCVGLYFFLDMWLVGLPNHIEGTASRSSVETQYLIAANFGYAVAWGTAAILYIRRRNATREAHHCVAGDVARYDVQWQKLLFADETRVQLTELAATWKRCYWISDKKTSASATVRQPYSKLAELYRHAFVVNIWFQDTLIPDWRKQMGLPTDQRFCNIKSPERAWVKCRRSYSGDVSRLSDVCRGEMVLQSVDELAKLLDIICTDRRVEVMRGKCRFLLSDLDTLRLAARKAAEEAGDSPLVPQDAAAAAQPPAPKAAVGYRDIQLSLRCKGVVVPAGAGADEQFVATCQQHRAEFQLHLAEFKAIKDSSGHEGYERFRILLGL